MHFNGGRGLVASAILCKVRNLPLPARRRTLAAMKNSPPIDETQAEARLRRALRRNRALATGLLGAAAAIFAATWAVHEPGFWVGLARAGAGLEPLSCQSD